MPINTIATGQPAAGGQQAAGQRAAGAGRRGRRGVTVAGEVKNYVPVTDAMLANPSPGDWLMIRRDYRASNYSPLTQITSGNVKDLRLRLVVGDERRRREPARAARSQRRRLSQ